MVKEEFPNTALSKFLFVFYFIHYWPLGNTSATLCLFLFFPAGHSVAYLEYTTHMDADHWQKKKERRRAISLQMIFENNQAWTWLQAGVH